jgi:filamentous hemagglutinin
MWNSLRHPVDSITNLVIDLATDPEPGSVAGEMLFYQVLAKGVAKGVSVAVGKTAGFFAPKAVAVDAEVTISRSKFPQTAKHIEDAQRAGQPDVLTIERSGADARRAQSLGGRAKISGQQLDEYPPAMFKEGGTGASVRAVDPADNMGAGAAMGNMLRNLPDGAKVRIKVGD